MIRWRLLVAEALVLLAMARLLVAGLPFGSWRPLLGRLTTAPSAGLASGQDRLLAKTVERASQRLAGQSKCLPQAMALYWMLRRRRRPAQLVIAVLPGAQRRGVDDLHAWAACGDEILIGALDQPFHAVARFGH